MLPFCFFTRYVLNSCTTSENGFFPDMFSCFVQFPVHESTCIKIFTCSEIYLLLQVIYVTHTDSNTSFLLFKKMYFRQMDVYHTSIEFQMGSILSTGSIPMYGVCALICKIMVAYRQLNP